MKRRKAAIANYFGLTKHRFTSCLPAQGLKRDISFGLSGEIVNLPGISLLTIANFFLENHHFHGCYEIANMAYQICFWAYLIRKEMKIYLVFVAWF